MLRSIDRCIRKIYGPLLMGLPLFFITVSPYSDKEAKDKEKGKRSFKQIAMDSQEMVRDALQGDVLMPDIEDPEAALYNLYLAKAAVPSPFGEGGPNREFIPLSTGMHTIPSEKVTYQDLLDAYLKKVEYMIDVEKDYFNALMELDKVMMIAPQNKKAQYLRTKLKQKLKIELENVKKKRSGQTSIQDDQIVDIKEKALLEAEKKLLAEAFETKPYSAKIKAEHVVNRISEDRISHREKEDMPGISNEVRKDSSRQEYIKKSNVSAPIVSRKHRDVVIVKNKDLLKIQPTEKIIGSEEVVCSEVCDASEIMGAAAMSAVENVDQQTAVMVGHQQQEMPAALETTEPENSKENKRDYTAVYEDRAKKYLLRGKQCYRNGNFALALISLSKAKQFDTQQQYGVEIEQLISMTRSRLETIANEG